MTREVTNKILEAIEEGILDRDTVIMACLKYMSEDDVADMAHHNELFPFDEEAEEEPDESDDPPGDSHPMGGMGYGITYDQTENLRLK